jgi:predicted O-methyltransferase YrrM
LTREKAITSCARFIRGGALSAVARLKALSALVPGMGRLKRQRDALVAEQTEFVRKVLAKVKRQARQECVALGEKFLEPHGLEDLGGLEEQLAAIRRVVAPVQGWVSDDSGALLYFAVRDMESVPNVVELGAWKGRSTVWLASGIRDRGEGRVYVVDTWRGTHSNPAELNLLRGYGCDELFDEFLTNLQRAGVTDFVEPIRDTTGHAAKRWPKERQIGLLFIDAEHAYQAVREDFDTWSPFVSRGGYVVLDDVPGWYGPTKLALDVVFDGKENFRIVGASENQLFLRKTHDS